jgi:fructose-bisphosphate aldolase, class II
LTHADLYTFAYGKYAIGAYNLDNLEQPLGLVQRQPRVSSSFITQLSKGARKYADNGILEVIIRKVQERYSSVPREFFLDHPE